MPQFEDQEGTPINQCITVKLRRVPKYSYARTHAHTHTHVAVNIHKISHVRMLSTSPASPEYVNAVSIVLRQKLHRTPFLISGLSLRGGVSRKGGGSECSMRA